MPPDTSKKAKRPAKQDQANGFVQQLGQTQQAGAMQQMQPMMNQLLGHHNGRSTKLNQDGTLKDMNAPSGLDWLQKNGPTDEFHRANSSARYQQLGRELRPEGGLPWMAQQGAQAVEAQKQMQQMQPQPQGSVTQQWGGDDVGAVSTATRNGVPVGFSTNTPQGKSLHQFSPQDFVSMLGQLPQGAPAQQGSMPQPGDERMPVNAFAPQANPGNPDNMYARDRAGVHAREQERQRHNPYAEQIQHPWVMDYPPVINEQFEAGGQQQGNMIADLLGYSGKLPRIQPHELPRAHVGPPVSAKANPDPMSGFWSSPLGWLLQAANPKNLSGLTSVPF